MPVDVLMPALSPTMESGALVRWLKQPGDPVAQGEVLAEIETDKATAEIEAIDEGVLDAHLVAAGTDDVAVGTVIARLRATGAAAPTATPMPPRRVPAMTLATTAPAPVIASPWLERPRSSPLARRIAAERGIDLATVDATGQAGRIILRDVEAAAAARMSPARPEATAPSSRPVPMPAPTPELPLLHERSPVAGEQVPHDRMRLTIARRLTEAKATVPHFYLEADCDIDRLVALRRDLNAAAPLRNGSPAYRLTLNDLIVRAYALALAAVPEANVIWSADAMVRPPSVDVAVGVAVPGGLITPVVRNADRISVAALSRTIADLAARARTRHLSADEMAGGTATVSNLGMHGVRRFAAIINPPQSSILAVGAARTELARCDGEIVDRTRLSVTLSVDHRAMDGSTAAQVLAAFGERVETPLTLVA